MSRITNPGTVTLPPGWWPGEQPPTSDGTESERAPKVNFRWATVTQMLPVRIRFDGDTETLGADVDRLVQLDELAVGRRVWVQLYERRVIVLGVASGSQYKSLPPVLTGQKTIGSTPYTTAKTAGGTVPGLLQTITLPVVGAVEVTISLDVFFSGPDTLVATATVGGITSDTQAVLTLPTYATGTTRFPVSKTWVFGGMPAGSTTMSIQAWSIGSSTVTIGQQHSQFSYRYSPNAAPG